MMRRGTREVAAAVRADPVEERRDFLIGMDTWRRNMRPRVLVADDNLVFARLLAATLDVRHGISVDIAATEEDVRVLLAQGVDYDLIVVDGTHGQASDVPVLYVSGRDVCACPTPCVPRCDSGRMSKGDGIAAIVDEIVRRVNARSEDSEAATAAAAP